MSIKEDQIKALCKLCGVEYHPPLKRWWKKVYVPLYNGYHNFHHVAIGYLIWGIMSVVPKKYKNDWFVLFEHWCFCHEVKRK